MKTGPRIILIIGAVVVVAVVAVLVLRPLLARRDGIHYVTRLVGFADIAATVNETGTVNPVNTVSVGSEVSGTVRTLGADYNSRVKKDQVLATLDPTTYQAAVDSSKANLKLAGAPLNRPRNPQLWPEWRTPRSAPKTNQTRILSPSIQNPLHQNQLVSPQLPSMRAPRARSRGRKNCCSSLLPQMRPRLDFQTF